MPGRHATTERPASTGWRAMSAAVRASSPESTVNSVSCRPSSRGSRTGVRLPPGVHKAYSRGHAQSGGTLSNAVPRIEALAGYKQTRPSPLHLSIIIICIIKYSVC